MEDLVNEGRSSAGKLNFYHGCRECPMIKNRLSNGESSQTPEELCSISGKYNNQNTCRLPTKALLLICMCNIRLHFDHDFHHCYCIIRYK